MPRASSSAGGARTCDSSAPRPRVSTAGCSRSRSWSPIATLRRAPPRGPSGGPTRRGSRCAPASARRSAGPRQGGVHAGTIAGAARPRPGPAACRSVRPARRARTRAGPRAILRPWRPEPASTSPAFPHLFTPITIGGATIRNRILSSGHDTVMAVDGLVTDRLVAYQEARARGGAGLIVIQVAGVHPTARYTSSELTADTDAAIPGFRALAEAVHRHGAMVFGQLFHGGREIMDTADGTLAVAWAPSAVPTERFHVMPRAMTPALIREIVDGFGAAAARLERAGLDGVEVVVVPRLPPRPVPQPAHEPAHRRVGRRRGRPAAVPARGAGRLPGGDPAGVRGGAADLDRRGDARGPHGGRGARGRSRRSTPTGRWTT